MQYAGLIDERVHTLYWNDDINCAATTLITLSEIFNICLCSQILNAVIGMPGAGRSGAQCGLVSGAIMVIGILGRKKGLEHEDIVDNCNKFVTGFETEFGSLNCRDLRPEGFKPDNPPHLCEGITKKAIMFTLNFFNSSLSS